MNARQDTVSAYKKLRDVNVNGHTEKKNGLTYLSWAWAVDQLLMQDHEATWEYSDPKQFGETLMVFCTVKAFGKAMTAQLPVMDHRNKAIVKPDAFQVNTAMQRALAKAIALHGLGLYIYAGEDLPPGDSDAENQKEKEFLKNIAAELVELVEVQGKAEDAFMYLEHQRLTNEEKLSLWEVLKPNSKTRSALKAERDRRNKPTPQDFAEQA